MCNLQELNKKFNETAQYGNMKQMLQTKNEQMKKLRQKLKKYDMLNFCMFCSYAFRMLNLVM